MTQITISEAKTYAVLIPKVRPIEQSGDVVSFFSEVFPTSVSYGSAFNTVFKTAIFETDSGLAAGESVWEHQKARYTITVDSLPESVAKNIIDFFYVVRGSAIGFNFKDWSDYKIENQQTFVGDGITTVFQVVKKYTSGNETYERAITKLVAGTLTTLKVDGVTTTTGFTVAPATGRITFDVAPSSGSTIEIVYAEFNVPVRFEQDYLSIELTDTGMASLSTSLIEIDA